MEKDIEEFEFLIIGAGPAGLQAGYYLNQAGRNYMLIEQAGNPGAFFNRFPRHRKMISINKVHTGYSDPELNLRWDWNSLLSSGTEPLLFKQHSQRYFPDAAHMQDYLVDYASHYELNIRTDATVTRISREQGFIVELASGEKFRAGVLIIATGFHLPWLPKIPGIEEASTYCDMDIDPVRLTNKRVLILGKGNSAFETADALVEHAAVIHLASPDPLKMAWSTHYVGHLRAVNNNMLDTYQLKSQNAILDAEIQAIERVGDKLRVTFDYKHAEGEQEVIEYDEVIACTGFRFDAGFFDNDCKPTLCALDKLPVQGCDWQSSNIPDLYFAGTLMQNRDYQKYMSGFIHGFRYNIKALSEILLERYCDQALPTRQIPLAVDDLTERLMVRINQSSALWQQPGFLADALVIDRQKEEVCWVEEQSVDYVHECWGGQESELLLLTLEFGLQKFDNPFNVSRIARTNVSKSGDSNFLHPIIRHYRNGQLCSEHHVIEDLAAEWWEREHIEPIRSYLETVV